MSRVPRLVLLLVLAAAVALIGSQGGRPLFSLYEDARLFVRDQHRAVNAWFGLPLPGTPDLSKLDQRLKLKGLSRGDPIFIRIFKRDSELELWMLKDGRYTLFETYPICFWSGRLGPKLAQGDAQSPEGFYTVSKGQLNPNSQYYRSFDLGFPNAFDRFHGRTGSHLMVHGDCVSRGCYAMTDAVMGEIWALVTAALDGPQSNFGVHVFPFRPTAWRLSLYDNHSGAQFWADLKPAYDAFEAKRIPPQIFACRGRYVIREVDKAAPTHPPVRALCPDAVAARSSHIRRTPFGAAGDPKAGALRAAMPKGSSS